MRFLRRQQAASVTELGLLAGLIAILLIGTLSLTGNRLEELFTIGGNAIDEVATLADQRTPNSAPEIDPVSGQTAEAGKEESFTISVQDNETLSRLVVTGFSPDPEIVEVTVSNLSEGLFEVSYKALAAAAPLTLILTATDHRGATDQVSVSVSVVRGVYASCQEAYQAGWRTDGVYQLDIDGEGGLSQDGYQCDMTTDGGGWTIIQNRESDTDFYHNWATYKAGFGTYPNFWLGNDKIHALTATPTELYVEVERYDHAVAYAKYSAFSIADEAGLYRLAISGYSGTAGDSLTNQTGMAFSTKDVDNDLYETSCAVRFHGAWWYRACHASNLNGDYGNNDYATGVSWSSFGGHLENHSMLRSKMMVR